MVCSITGNIAAKICAWIIVSHPSAQNEEEWGTHHLCVIVACVRNEWATRPVEDFSKAK
jgi:hypothetical protein